MTKILLVEDDRSLREIYGVRLLAEGYDIVSAGDGEEALAMAIKERPNLIISDVMMPKISGFDMLDILRSTTETKDIKVIMMTALSSEDQRARGEQLGADRYLVKSQVGIEDVVRTVHEVLGDSPSAQSTTPAQPPVTAAAPAPEAPSHNAEPEPANMPRPTAPFSSPRPATLGERVIQPINSVPLDNSSDSNLADRIAAELSAAEAPAPTESSQSETPIPTTPEPNQINTESTLRSESIDTNPEPVANQDSVNIVSDQAPSMPNQNNLQP